MKVSWVLFVSVSVSLLGMACITLCASTNGTVEIKKIDDSTKNLTTKTSDNATEIASEKSHKGGRRVIKQSKNDARSSDSRVVVSTIPTTKPRKATKKPQIQKKSTKKTANELICPKNAEKLVGWFALPCTNNKSCQIMGKKHVCCKVNNYKRCVLGVPKPISEPRHEPILGLIQQKCPKTPLAELFWEIKTCDTDADCWPRVCCPDGQRKYCRSATVELQKSDIPFARSLANPLEAMSGYIQCTPPPAAQFDLYPKPCNNTLDCFPNVCCQEKGRKHCRPPKRSLLALITTMTQNVSAQWLKEWASNLVIP